MAFKRAVKSESKLRLAISGPAGSGKTYTALTLAKHLAAGQPIAFIDTEHGSASKYSDLFDFDVMELEAPFHPDRYIAAMREAQEAGYAVLVIDSLSHAWEAAGGLLEEHEKAVKRSQSKNSYTAWAEITPIQTRFIESILAAKMHIIATMRSKVERIQVQENGRTQIKTVGMAPRQREGVEYEFDVMLAMDQSNTAVVEKSRCPALNGAVIEKPGKDVAAILREWLSGEPAEEKPEMVPLRDAWMAPASVAGVLTPTTEDESYVPDTLAKPFNPLADVEFRQRLKKLGYVSVKQVEEFLVGTGGSKPTRDECFSALEDVEAKADLAATGTFGTRGN